MLLLPVQSAVSDVVTLTRATFPAVAAMAIVPEMSGVGSDAPLLPEEVS